MQLTTPTYSYERIRCWLQRLPIFKPSEEQPHILTHKTIYSNYWNCNHYILSIIDFQHCTIGYYDSSQSHLHNTHTILHDILMQEQKCHCPSVPFDFSAWQDLGSLRSPGQYNGCDCGIFLSHAACYLITHSTLDRATFAISLSILISIVMLGKSIMMAVMVQFCKKKIVSVMFSKFSLLVLTHVWMSCVFVGPPSAQELCCTKKDT